MLSAKGDWAVYSTDSHLIWCHYARATLIFKKKGEGREERQRLSYATKAPWGVWDFFLRARAMQRSGHVCDHDSPTPPRPLGHSSGPGVGKALVFDTIFSIFCLTAMADVWKHALCVFRKAGCAAESPPHRWPCVERRLLPHTLAHRGKMASVFGAKTHSLPVSGLEMSHEESSSASSPCVSRITSGCFVLLCFCFHLFTTLTRSIKEDNEWWNVTH